MFQFEKPGERLNHPMGPAFQEISMVAEGMASPGIGDAGQGLGGSFSAHPSSRRQKGKLQHGK